MLNSDPGLLVGRDRFTNVEYNGTFYINTEIDDDYAGIVFNYQSNRRFMLVSWKQTTQKYWNDAGREAMAGLQIQMVKSSTGPGEALMNALWSSSNSKRQVGMQVKDWPHTRVIVTEYNMSSKNGAQP